MFLTDSVSASRSTGPHWVLSAKESEKSEEHDMSSVLKRYLHDLPQPLFTHALYPQLLALR